MVQFRAAAAPSVASRLELREFFLLLARAIELWVRLCPAITFYVVVRLFRLTWLRERWLRSLVAALAKNGPVGIKWGQWASTRYDLFEEDLCEALNQLTNQAPVHSFDHSKRLVESAFGATLPELFSSFDSTPLASGSIAQVHRAVLRDDGTDVIVKVQHPGLGRRLALDMYLLRALSKGCGRLHALRGLRISETVDQFASNFTAQLDFRDEAANLLRFAANFDTSFWRAIISFPRPIERYVARQVLLAHT